MNCQIDLSSRYVKEYFDKYRYVLPISIFLYILPCCFGMSISTPRQRLLSSTNSCRLIFCGNIFFLIVTMSLFCIAAGDKFVPVTIEENDLFGGITKVLKVLRPTWPLDNVKFKVRRKVFVTETNSMEVWTYGVYLFYTNFPDIYRWNNK